MSLISSPHSDHFNFFKRFIQPEEIKFKQGDVQSYQIVSIKSKPQKQENLQNLQRSAWRFLTLGIPALIDSFSIFFSEILHRHSYGISLKVRFKHEQLPLEKIGKLVKFHQFNQLDSKPLNEASKNKAMQLMLQLVNLLDEAKVNDQKKEYQNKIDKLQALLEKNFTYGTSRADFNESDWEMTDLIEYELACEYFKDLTDLFNAEWMSNSALKKELNELFGIDYQESVIAESLALSLAYIENIEGKVIALPVYDPETKTYHSTSYLIKQTFVGDALPCYLLEAENKNTAPWFIVRGTQPYIKVSQNNKEYRVGGLESLLADSLDPECISRNVINKALSSRPIQNKEGAYFEKKSVADIFRELRLAGKKVNLSGHSLGGTIVNSLAVEFYDQIKTAYAYSPAGVSHKTANRWNALNKSYPEMSLNKKLVNFDYDGDMVPSGGRKLIGNHLALKALIPLGPTGIYHSHVRSHLNYDFQIQKIDVEKEAHKWARVFCEYVRIIVGKSFLFLLSFLNSRYLPDWWKNRKIYKLSADKERQIRYLLTHLTRQERYLD